MRRGKHRIDFAMAVSVTVRVDIASFLGPGCGDELAAPFRIAFVLGGEIADDGFVDV